jgi:hypothetical protein
MPCVCTIPSLNMEAESLNHAFTIISEAYETKRRSHSGNVFERAYAQNDSGHWNNLDDLRLETLHRMLADRSKGSRINGLGDPGPDCK